MNTMVARPNIIAAIIVFLCLIGLLVTAPMTRPLNCDMECGETLLSLRAAQQYRLFGIDYGLLENIGTHEEPLIYTHNVNIGTLTFVGLEALGVPDTYKFLLPLAAFGLGLAYVYLTVRRVSGDQLLALVTLLLFATTYWGLGAYALNALRAWHLLAFFVVIHHVYGLARLSWSLPDILGLCIGAILAFGCGYDFWIICAVVALLVGLSNLDRYSLWRIMGFAIALGAIFALPFLLRQLHVAWAMGLPFWEQDFIYSFAIKVPFASNFIKIPSLDIIDAYYRNLHVLRPPASPANSASQIFFTFRHMVTSVTIPRWGLASLLALGSLLAIILVPKVWRSPLGTYIRGLIVPATLGTVIGLIIFAPFSLHVYFKHEFPLIAFPLLLAKSCIISFLISMILAKRSAWKVWTASAFLLVLVVDMAMVDWNNTRYGPALNFGWGEAFAQYPNEEIALTIYRLIPIADKYIGVDESRAVYVTPEQMLGGKSDIHYWIYQPSDRFVDFDSPVPLCNWVDWFSQLTHRRFVVRPGVSCIYDQPLPSNSKRQPSVSDIIRASAEMYDVVQYDKSTNGYVILKRKQP